VQFDRIAAVVRPRSPWEAVDLGILLVRAWWRPIMTSWFAVTFPFFLLLNLVFYRHPIVAISIFWWLKPLWERPILHIISRGLFGEVPTLRQTLRNFAKEAGRQLFASLLWRRFSPTRSMDLPVTQLENLKGNVRDKRLRLLHNTLSNAAFWLTFVCMHIEAVLMFGVLFLLVMLVPQGVDIDWRDMLRGENQNFLLLQNVVIYLAISFVAPFFVAGGFSLYINRRTQLEAWDVEIGFRQIRNRLLGVKAISAAASVLVCALLVSTAFIRPVLAEENAVSTERQSSAKIIKDIMRSEEFHQIETFRVLKGFDDLDEKDKKEQEFGFPRWLLNIIRWLARSAEAILWSAVIVLILLFAHKYRYWLLQYVPATLHRKRELAERPKTLFGMAVDKESLPGDIVGQVELLWESNEYRSALSLLYRATLANLIENYGVQLSESHTEKECERIIKRQVAGEVGQYFSELNRYWCCLAYAHKLPDKGKILGMCQQWKQYFLRADQ
jgi:hypothetical protein